MLKKIGLLMLAFLLCAAAVAEPFRIEGEQASVAIEYRPETNRTLYTLSLNDGARFMNGDPLSAEDVLFTLYYRLDPSQTDVGIPVIGLDSYRRQVSPQRYNAAMATIAAIHAAGRDSVPTDADSWTMDQQRSYWALTDEFAAACEREYPNCAQAIVNYFTERLAADPVGAFGLTSEEIAANEGLAIAYTMLQSGYGMCEDGTSLTATRSRIVWELAEGVAPTIDDFVRELKLVYGDDLMTCWQIEGAGGYVPELPDVTEEMLTLLLAGTQDSVTSIEGIRMTDVRTVEITIEGCVTDAAGPLFGAASLSLNAYGDTALWNPEQGLYGHPFGNTDAVTEACMADSSAIVELIPATFGFFMG